MLKTLYRCGYRLRTQKRLIQVMVAVPAFILGIAGGYLEFGHREELGEYLWSTILYRTLQMFVLELDPIGDPIGNIPFWIAHWLAMILAASVVFEVLLHFSGQWITSWLIRFFGKEHVILCGLGDDGIRLVEKLFAAGHQVVVIEPDETHLDLEACRKAGAVTFSGDPASGIMLAKAGIATAGHVLILFNLDGVNFQIARVAREQAVQRRSKPLSCTLQIRDRSLLELLNREELKTNVTDNFELEVFHSDEVLSRTMLREASWASLARAPQRFLVFVNTKSMRTIETFMIRAVRDWIIESKLDSPPAEFTLIGEGAAQIELRISQCYPEIFQNISLKAWDQAPETWVAFEQDPQLRLDPNNYDVAFMLADREEQALTGVTLLQRLSAGSLPIIVNVREVTNHFLNLLPKDTEDSSKHAENIRVVSSEKSVFNVDMVKHPEIELLAQCCHQDYLIDHLNRGAIEKSAVTPWSELPETFRDANRALALRLSQYLSGNISGTKKIEKEYVSSRPVSRYQFSAEELELLAKEEHQNWVLDRKQQGWKQGSVRDDHKKIHPNMVPWEELSESDRELDRNIIRRIPTVFARMDIELAP